jgi:hypothetical protein
MTGLVLSSIQFLSLAAGTIFSSGDFVAASE